MDALTILEAMIREEATIANNMSVAFPLDFERLNAGTGMGVRLQALIDAKSRIRKALMEELESERESGTLGP